MPFRYISRFLRLVAIGKAEAARSRSDCGYVWGVWRCFRCGVGDDCWPPLCRRNEQPVKPHQMRTWRQIITRLLVEHWALSGPVSV